MRTTLQILTEARALIERPENWAKRSYGLNGGPMCAVGAIWRAGNYNHEIVETMNEMCGGLSFFNDNHEHAEVLALFDRAIEAERAKERPTDISVFTAMLENQPAKQLEPTHAAGEQ